MKKKIKAGMPLDEVFAGSEKDPGWNEAYAKADLDVRMAIQIARAREKAKLTQDELAKAIGTNRDLVIQLR